MLERENLKDQLTTTPGTREAVDQGLFVTGESSTTTHRCRHQVLDHDGNDITKEIAELSLEDESVGAFHSYSACQLR